MQPDIVAIGEPMLEFNATEDGALSEVRQFVVGWGGDTSNFSVAASRLGASVGYITRLGDDEFAKCFLDLWEKEGIDTRQVFCDPEAFTGIYFISRKEKQHFFTYYRKQSAASFMDPDFIPVDYIQKAKLLHVSGISQGISTSACDAMFTAIKAAKSAGVIVSYDTNLRLKLWPLERATAVIHQTIKMADIVLPSLEDATTLTAMSDPEEIAAYYLSLGPKVVVLKLGGDGAILAYKEDGEGESRPKIQKFSPYKVEFIDGSGAGDTFDGGFVVGYLAGWSFEKCVRFANAAAALSTTGLGCVLPIPRRNDVEAFLATQES